MAYQNNWKENPDSAIVKKLCVTENNFNSKKKL